jgi:hypothetical protein
MPLPVGQGPPTPAAVARALLDRVVAYYEAHADDEVDPPAPLPERRLISAGEPRLIAWDGDLGQVHVSYERTVLGMRPTQPAPSSRTGHRDPANAGRLVRSCAMEVQIVRPAPALGWRGRIPGLDAIDAHGYACGIDLAHLSHAAVEAAKGRHLQRDNVREAEVIIGDCLSLGPSGALAAVALGITVPLL